ncbi:MAG: Holliday junction resolvase RuvX [Dehalococcoidia bacterium]|nr:Holliday junction resolvase RuvX [Dehalococcoidia bacterium]
MGVAVSDELGMMAHRRAAITGGDVLEQVARIVEAEDVAEVVVGLPLTLAGGESDQTREARAFASQLRKKLGIRVTEWDERLSSAQAERDVKGRKRRQAGDVDSAAAEIVLQSVLDARRGGQR